MSLAKAPIAHDGLIDFDQAVRDSDHAESLRPAFEGGDCGYEATAQSVALALFR